MVYFLRGGKKRIAVTKEKTSFVLTFDMPLKRSCNRNIMKSVLLFCIVLHTFWYSQDTQTVCLLIFKNKYKGKLSADASLFFFLNTLHILLYSYPEKHNNNKKKIQATVRSWVWHFLFKARRNPFEEFSRQHQINMSPMWRLDSAICMLSLSSIPLLLSAKCTFSMPHSTTHDH